MSVTISGKQGAQRAMVLGAVAAGRVVHVAGAGGLWRVTPTGIGPLWEKIRQPCPDRRPAPSRGLYEQLQQGPAAGRG